MYFKKYELRKEVADWKEEIKMEIMKKFKTAVSENQVASKISKQWKLTLMRFWETEAQ